MSSELERITTLASEFAKERSQRLTAIEQAREEAKNVYNDLIDVVFKEAGMKWRSAGSVFEADIRRAQTIGDDTSITFKFAGNILLRITVKVKPTAFGAVFSGTSTDTGPASSHIPLRYMGQESISASQLTQSALEELVTGRLEAALQKHLPER